MLNIKDLTKAERTNILTSIIDAIHSAVNIHNLEGKYLPFIPIDLSYGAAIVVDVTSIVDTCKKLGLAPVIDFYTLGCDAYNFAYDFKYKRGDYGKLESDLMKIGKDAINIGVRYTPQGKLVTIVKYAPDLAAGLFAFAEGLGIYADTTEGKNILNDFSNYLKERGVIDEEGRYIGKGSGSGLGNSGVGYGGYSDYGFRGNQIIYGSDENDNDDDTDKDKDKKEDKESDGGWWKDLRSSIPPWFWRICDKIWDIWQKIDPVVLNLSKEETATLNYIRITQFDYDGDGFAEMTEWIGQNQGLLVMDRNGNGIIDDGSELFGNQTVLSNGRQAVDGYQALAELDDNKDEIIDASDISWSKLLVWVDNGDGVTQNDELKTLDELGIVSLSLNEDTSVGDSHIKNIGTFTWSDGNTGEMNDYLFTTNTLNTYNKRKVEVSEEVAKELYLPASGMLEDSWQVMMKSEDDTLKSLLKSYVEAAEEDKSGILNQILFTMAGDSEKNTSYGPIIDSRKRHFIEKFYGTKFSGGTNIYNSRMLEDLYSNIKRYYEGWISAQTTVSDYLSKIEIIFDDETSELSIDFTQVKSALDEKIATDFESGKKLLAEFTNAMHAVGLSNIYEFNEMCQEYIAQNDELAIAIYTAGRNIIKGTKKRNNLSDDACNNIIIGGDDRDNLTAHGEDVILVGGKGKDYLYGSRGRGTWEWGEPSGTEKVTYIWNVGDGNDTIINAASLTVAKQYSGTSYIYMGVGITADKLKFSRKGEDIYIENIDTKEYLTIRNWFVDDVYKIDGIVFADGSYLNRSKLIELAEDFHTTDDNDSLIGGVPLSV